jgi:hypothetical protein
MLPLVKRVHSSLNKMVLAASGKGIGGKTPQEIRALNKGSLSAPCTVHESRPFSFGYFEEHVLR